MKLEFHILPHNDIKKAGADQPKEWKPLYGGTNRFLHFLSENALFLLSFLLPIATVLFCMAAEGMAPFGEKSLFILDGAKYNLSIFTSFVNQLHTGDFSFFAQSGSFGSEYFSTILYYLCSPIHLLLCLFPADTAAVLLMLVTVMQIGIAGLCMALYLTHRQRGTVFSRYDFSVLIFSLGYALSSYLLVQYNDFMFLDCAILFPIVMLTFERLIYQNKKLPFFVCLVYLFFSNFYITGIMCIFLFLYLLTIQKGDFHQSCALLRRFLFVVFGSALVSAVTVVPGFYALYRTKILASVWPDFSFATDWLSVFSRLLPFNYGSYVKTEQLGNNLYCGLLILPLFLLSLFDKKQELSERIRNLVYITLIALCLNIAPLQYVMHLGIEDTSLFNCYGFLLPFFLLAFGSNAVSHIRSNSLLRGLAALAVPFALYFSAAMYAKDYANRSSLSMTLIFLVIYALLLLFYRIGSIGNRSFYPLLLVFVVAELLGNTITNFGYIAMDAGELSSLSAPVSSSWENQNIQPFTFDLDQDFSMQPCAFKAGDFTLSDGNAPDIFSQQNEIAASLGAEDDLFTKASLKIGYEASENIIVRQTKDNIFTLRVKPDTPNAKTPYNRIILTITPDRSGDLYLYTTEPVHIGQVTAGESVTCSMSFPTSSNIYENYWVYGAFLQTDTLQKLQSSLSCDYTMPQRKGLTAFTMNLTVPADGTAILNIPYSPFIRITEADSTVTAAEGPAMATALSLPAGSHAITITLLYTPFYLGLILSLLSAALLLICRKREKKYHPSAMFARLEDLYLRNQIPVLSVCIPFVILIAACIISGYQPFGVDTFFKNDGAALTIPTFYQAIHQFKSGSLLYAWTSGGGSNIFYAVPTMCLYFWLLLIPEQHLIPVLTIMQVLKIALCGLSMYFYLTKREIGQRMYRSDYRILMFTTAYSLSSYILNMRGFFFWVDVLFLFPLILLAMDRLMLHKKKSLYILLLAFAMLQSNNIALFVCIFLVMTFFTYPFRNFADFIKKGIRFALSSILSAGMTFFVLVTIVMGMRISPYRGDDSVFPTFTFYQSFWDSLKQSFSFADPVIISVNDGAINLYCGVFCLLLALLYLFLARNTKVKFIKLGFMLFVFFSSNNNMLSYIWNGFHYQTKVPNRYSFLLIFLLIDVASESLSLLHRCKKRTLCASFGMIALLSCLIFAFSKERPSMLSFGASCILIVSFFVLLLLSLSDKKKHAVLQKAIVCLALAELCLNTCFCFATAEFSKIDDISHYSSITDYLKNEYLGDSLTNRVSYLGLLQTNQGMVNHVNYINQFNSFLTSNQRNLGSALGYGISNNIIEQVDNVTPFANATTNVKYLVLDEYTSSEFTDIAHYTPIASRNGYTILENRNAISFAFYMPYETIAFTDNISSAEGYATGFVKGYLPDTDLFSDLYEIGNVAWKESDPTNNYVLSAGENDTYLQYLHFVPKKSGEYYARTHEFFYLGYLEGGKAYDFELEATADSTILTSIYHNDVFEAFAEEASKYTMEITDFSNTTVDGTITLPKDGCVYFSIPYESGWRAYVDGKETPLGTIPSGMFLTAEAGSHTIHLSFRPDGLTLAVSVTLACWGIYLLVALFEFLSARRKKAKQEQAHNKAIQ